MKKIAILNAIYQKILPNDDLNYDNAVKIHLHHFKLHIQNDIPILHKVALP